jgi:hypothetical protein
VNAGVLSPLEAITAATLNGAHAIGIENDYGSIEVGKVADLVVLSEDPTADIGALQSVVAVFKDGRCRVGCNGGDAPGGGPDDTATYRFGGCAITRSEGHDPGSPAVPVTLVQPTVAVCQKESASVETRVVRELPGTIAIAAAGPNAGMAAFRALQEAEKVAAGSIGGVAVMDVMLTDGTICSYGNFGRGGTGTLFVRGEETGVSPPPEIAAAPIAVIVSTGPRDSGRISGDPCVQDFPSGADRVGLVVGHRLPDAPGRDGEPVNAHVLRLMKEGLSPREAVGRVMSAVPEVDAGLIAVSADGVIAMHNSRRVDRRPDYGHARGEDEPSGAVVETILNEIHPPQAIAQLVVNVALETMTGLRRPELEVLLRSGLTVEYANELVVEVDGNRVVTRVTTDVREHLGGEAWAVVPYIHSRVVQDGQTLGYTIVEPLAHLLDGTIQSLSYQEEMTIGVKREPRTCEFRTPHLTVCTGVVEGRQDRAPPREEGP